MENSNDSNDFLEITKGRSLKPLTGRKKKPAKKAEKNDKKKPAATDEKIDTEKLEGTDDKIDKKKLEQSGFDNDDQIKKLRKQSLSSLAKKKHPVRSKKNNDQPAKCLNDNLPVSKSAPDNIKGDYSVSKMLKSAPKPPNEETDKSVHQDSEAKNNKIGKNGKHHSRPSGEKKLPLRKPKKVKRPSNVNLGEAFAGGFDLLKENFVLLGFISTGLILSTLFLNGFKKSLYLHLARLIIEINPLYYKFTGYLVSMAEVTLSMIFLFSAMSIALKSIDNKDMEFSDIFPGFYKMFSFLFSFSLFSVSFWLMFFVFFFLVGLAAHAIGELPGILVGGAIFLLLLLRVMANLSMFPFVILDDECGFFDPLVCSNRITTGRESGIIPFFVLFFIIFFILGYAVRFIPSIVCLVIHDFLVIPFWACSWTHIYRTIKPK